MLKMLKGQETKVDAFRKTYKCKSALSILNSDTVLYLMTVHVYNHDAQWLTLKRINPEVETRIDPRHKINLFLEKLAKNFQKHYDLGENLTIDESLVHFKGRNSMKFYIPMNPHKWGFKIHLLCDSDTHYLYTILYINFL